MIARYAPGISCRQPGPFKPPPGWVPPPVPTAPIPVAQHQGEADYAPCIDLDDPMFDGQRDDVVYAD